MQGPDSPCPSEALAPAAPSASLPVEAWPAANDAESARRLIAIVQAHLPLQGIHDFRPPPPEPTTCCGRGCNGCVWEGFFAALQWWTEDAQARLQAG